MAGVGEKIKNARQIKGMSQEALARAIGSTKSTISKYELGHREPSLDTIQRIADALRVDLLDLVTPTRGQIYFDKVLKAAEEGKKRGLRVVWNGDGLFLTQPDKEQKILFAFDKLNDDGQSVAVERVEELTEIPKYQKKEPDEPDNS